jgi:hypothetical protein
MTTAVIFHRNDPDSVEFGLYKICEKHMLHYGLSYTNSILPTDRAAAWLALLFRIWEVTETGYNDLEMSWFYSVPPVKFRYVALN